MIFKRACWLMIECGRRIAVLILLAVLVRLPAFSQMTGATLSGLITDKSGGAVPSASVAIRNADTGETRDIVSNNSGFYSAPNLLPGNYDVSVTAKGFSRELQSGVTLTVGAQQELNFNLTVGAMSETVEVRATPPSVDTASSTNGATVDSRTVAGASLEWP